MKTVSIPTAGQLAFWTPKACSHARILASMDTAGLSDWAPKPRTDRSALETALKDYGAATVDKNLSWEVKSLKEPGLNGYELVEIIKGEYRNSRSHVVSVRIKETGGLEVTAGWGDLPWIEAKYAEHKGICTSESVSQCLVKMVTKMIHGVTLRETGGLYWVPDYHTTRWLEAAKAVEDGSETRVSSGAWEANPNTIKDIAEALIAEVAKDCVALKLEITDGAVHTKEYFERRLEATRSIMDKVVSIEGALQTTLTPCREAIQEVDQLVALCAMATI